MALCHGHQTILGPLSSPGGNTYFDISVARPPPSPSPNQNSIHMLNPTGGFSIIRALNVKIINCNKGNCKKSPFYAGQGHLITK